MISILLAKSQNDVIGQNNDLPWHISEDLKYFKKLTTGKTIVMGRHTFESIGHALPNRQNYVVTRSPDFSATGVHAIHGVADIKSIDAQDIFIIGGASLLKETMAIADRLYLTEIHHDFAGDVSIHIDMSQWILVQQTKGNQDGKSEYEYDFCVYDRA